MEHDRWSTQHDTGADDDERMEKGSSQFEIEIPQDEKEMLVREALNYLGIKNPVDLPMICKTLGMHAFLSPTRFFPTRKNNKPGTAKVGAISKTQKARSF